MWTRGLPVAQGCLTAHCYRPFKLVKPKRRTHDSRHVVRASSVFDVQKFDELPSNERGKVLDAMDQLKYRATAAEVSAATGLPIKATERCLQSLTADVQGSMQVSSAGDLVYALPSNFRAKLLATSLYLRIEPSLEKFGTTAAYVGRVAFGSALFLSVLVTYVAIIAIMQSQSRSSDDRDRGPRMGGGGFNLIYWDPYAVWFWDPYYARKSRQRSPEDMSFLESVFSVVFGDGDPNADFQENRWQRVSSYIQSQGGVVTALELAPFLDPPDPSSLQDEAFMVPALLKFDGEVTVTEEGNTLYVFPQLQRVTGSRSLGKTASRFAAGFRDRVQSAFARSTSPVPSEPLLEAPWRLSKAPRGNVAGAWALAAVNIGGVAYLSSLVASIPLRTLALSDLSWIPAVLPALQAYAALFVAIPAVRLLLNMRRNDAITKRNAARTAAAASLKMLSPGMKAKLAQARSLAQTTAIDEDDVVFSTEGELKDGRDEEYASFDRRLRDKARDL